MIERPPAPLPAWVPAVDRALAAASAEIRPIRAATPLDAEVELARVAAAWARGQEVGPAFRYADDHVRLELRPALERLAARVEGEGPLGAIYAARARELALEAEMVEAVGAPRLRHLAAQRFLGAEGEARGRADLARADAWARAWTASFPGRDATAVEDALVRTDDEREPSSLVSRLAAELGARRLPLRVVVQRGLPSLAATSDDGVVLVVPGRLVRRVDVERTVMHELDGHVSPQAAALAAPIGIFAVGTARGVDDQEGRALALERRAGFLDPPRLYELGLRHIGASATLAGANFVEVVRELLGRGAPVDAALRIAARVQRGAAITGGGLAREIVYLPALARVERALASSPDVERMMARGRIAADAAPTLAAALG